MLVVQIKTLQYTLVVTVSWWLIDFYGFYFIERKGREKHPLAVLLCVHSWLALACALTGTDLQPWCGGWRSPAELRPGLCSVLGICEWPLVRTRLDKMRECRRPPLGGENTNNAACSNPLLSEQICVCFQNYFRVRVSVNTSILWFYSISTLCFD